MKDKEIEKILIFSKMVVVRINLESGKPEIYYDVKELENTIAQLNDLLEQEKARLFEEIENWINQKVIKTSVNPTIFPKTEWYNFWQDLKGGEG